MKIKSFNPFIILSFVLLIFLLAVINVCFVQKAQIQSLQASQVIPSSSKWEYLADDWNLDRFTIQFPYGWTVANGNHPRQYSFSSPDLVQESTDMGLNVRKGAWISLGIFPETEHTLEDLRKSIEKDPLTLEVKDSTLGNQPAIWYKQKSVGIDDTRITVATLKDKQQYSLLLVHDANQPGTEQYYDVFNAMVGNFEFLK